MPDGTEEPFSRLDTAMITLHETFTGFMAAGFTEDQAMFLTGVVLTESMRGAPNALPVGRRADRPVTR